MSALCDACQQPAGTCLPSCPRRPTPTAQPSTTPAPALSGLAGWLLRTLTTTTQAW